MAGYVQLQPLVTITAPGSETQKLELAVDIGDFNHLIVVVQRPVKADFGTLWLQHAPVLADDAFVDLATFSLAHNATESRELEGVSRYLRWRGEVVGSQNPAFQIDLVGR